MQFSLKKTFFNKLIFKPHWITLHLVRYESKLDDYPSLTESLKILFPIDFASKTTKYRFELSLQRANAARMIEQFERKRYQMECYLLIYKVYCNFVQNYFV